MTERNIFAGGEFLTTDVKPEDIFIPEELTKEHKMIYKAALDFLKKEILPNVEEIEKKNEELVRSLLETAGDLGLNGTDIPEEFESFVGRHSIAVTVIGDRHALDQLHDEVGAS